MTLTERIEDWRTTLIESHTADGLPLPSEEEVLSQFLYCAIADCLDNPEILELALSNDDEALDQALNAWVDGYAKSDSTHR